MTECGKWEGRDERWYVIPVEVGEIYAAGPCINAQPLPAPAAAPPRHRCAPVYARSHARCTISGVAALSAAATTPPATATAILDTDRSLRYQIVIADLPVCRGGGGECNPRK